MLSHASHNAQLPTNKGWLATNLWLRVRALREKNICGNHLFACECYHFIKECSRRKLTESLPVQCDPGVLHLHYNSTRMFVCIMRRQVCMEDQGSQGFECVGLRCHRCVIGVSYIMQTLDECFHWSCWSNYPINSKWVTKILGLKSQVMYESKPYLKLTITCNYLTPTKENGQNAVTHQLWQLFREITLAHTHIWLTCLVLICNTCRDIN